MFPICGFAEAPAAAEKARKIISWANMIYDMYNSRQVLIRIQSFTKFSRVNQWELVFGLAESKLQGGNLLGKRLL